VNQNATVCGKYWFVILYTCRIVLTGAIANPVYSDEQSSFKCNTLQVGCENVCFNQISPMSQIRFWTVQIIFTCAPTVIFILWAINSVHCMNALIDRIMNEREDHRRCTMLSVAGLTMTRSSSVSSDFSILDEKRRMRVIQDEIETIVDQLPSILLGYVVQLLVRIALEVAFTLFQLRVYGIRIKPIYDCDRWPCRVLTECYMSRQAEGEDDIHLDHVRSHHLVNSDEHFGDYLPRMEDNQAYLQAKRLDHCLRAGNHST